MKGKHNKSLTRAEKLAAKEAKKTKPTASLDTLVKEQATKQTASEEEIQIKDRLTPEAKSWLVNPFSLAGSVYLAFKPQQDGTILKEIEPCPPWRYLSWPVINEAADIKGSPLTLEDVQSMVKPEGESTHCRGTGIEFQPMTWWRFCPHDMKKSLESGVAFKDLMPEDKWGGAFFWVWIPERQENELQVYSGAQFKGDGELSTGSPLIIAARILAKLAKMKSKRQAGVQHIWGRSKAAIIGQINARKQGKNAAIAAHQELEDNIFAQLTGKPARQTSPPTNTGNKGLITIGELLEADKEEEANQAQA